jgi:hypothetical protein
METKNLNKEEIQSLVDNFITNNVNEIQKISQDNPLLFESVTNILSFISTKLGTREGAIEIPKVEQPISSTLNAIEEDLIDIGLCYLKNYNVLNKTSGFYELKSTKEEGNVQFIFENASDSFTISYDEFGQLLENDDVKIFKNLKLETIYVKELKDGAKIIFKIEPTYSLGILRLQYGEEFKVANRDTKQISYRFQYSKDFNINFSDEISFEINGVKRFLTSGNLNKTILEQLDIEIQDGGIKVLENAPSTTSNVSWDKENILCYVKEDLFGLGYGFYSLSYSESRNEVKFVDNFDVQKNPNMNYSELVRLMKLGDVIIYNTIQLNDGSNIYYFEEDKNILLEIVLNTNSSMVSILLVDKFKAQTANYNIYYDYDGDVEIGSFIVYKHSGKEDFLTSIWRRIAEKEIVLAPKNSNIVQTLYPQTQQATTTATTTAKKGRKALSQDQKDRISEIKLEIEGLELIADDDDDAKEEIEKLKNEIKQIKNS